MVYLRVIRSPVCLRQALRSKRAKIPPLSKKESRGFYLTGCRAKRLKESVRIDLRDAGCSYFEFLIGLGVRDGELLHMERGIRAEDKAPRISALNVD